MPGMLKYSLPVKKGFFVVRFFALRTEEGRFQNRREAVGIPGKPGMIPIIRRCR